MGLSQSIRRRLKITEGETFSTKLKIFLAGRQKRRAFELKKFGHYLTGYDPNLDHDRFLTEIDLLDAILDEDWYKETHKLDSADSCLKHYLEQGRTHAFAPNAALAGEDGVSLSNWGLEYLARCGVKIGDASQQVLSAGDSRAIDPFKITNSKKKKIAVVTAIFGNYDVLMPVDAAWKTKADFFVFSDRFFEASDHWQHVHSPYHHVDPRRKARFVKLNLPVFFEDYEWVMWVDGNVLICCDPETVISRVSDKPFDFATFTHSDRTSIMAEAAACVYLGKENVKELAEHFDRLGIIDRAPKTGLLETMAMVLRPASPSVKQLFTAWWGLLIKGSKRDQLSLPIAMAAVPDVMFSPFPETINKSGVFFRAEHGFRRSEPQ